jgi:hypothetical protein
MAAIADETAPIARQALFFHFESRPRDIDLPDNSPEDTGKRLYVITGEIDPHSCVRCDGTLAREWKPKSA